jgi:hypothetical protein
MKALPKFHGNRKKLEEPLKTIFKVCHVKTEDLNDSEKVTKKLREVDECI